VNPKKGHIIRSWKMKFMMLLTGKRFIQNIAISQALCDMNWTFILLSRFSPAQCTQRTCFALRGTLLFVWTILAVRLPVTHMGVHDTLKAVFTRLEGLAAPQWSWTCTELIGGGLAEKQRIERIMVSSSLAFESWAKKRWSQGSLSWLTKVYDNF